MLSQPKIIAHRGGAGLRPENTLAAIDHAIALGVDGVEVDVHLSADGHVIVHHDEALNADATRCDGEWLRTTGPLVKELTLSELHTYDVGRLKPGSELARKHPDQTPADAEKIPQLRDALARLQKDDAGDVEILIELKSHPTDPALSSDPEYLTDGILDVLNTEGMIARAILISFNWQALDYAHSCAPELRTGYLTYPRAELMAHQLSPDVIDAMAAGPRAFQAMSDQGARFWGPYYKEATRDLVALAHGLDLAVSVWTANDRASFDALTAAGVDYITTDYPDRLLDIRGGNAP